jgi:hypothetical protein
VPESVEVGIAHARYVAHSAARRARQIADSAHEGRETTRSRSLVQLLDPTPDAVLQAVVR